MKLVLLVEVLPLEDQATHNIFRIIYTKEFEDTKGADINR